ncbi:MAG: hypothetical protein RBS24_01975 [Bacilli bacterium]|nr:hypothetical protein [Bacilli bacterium]
MNTRKNITSIDGDSLYLKGLYIRIDSNKRIANLQVQLSGFDYVLNNKNKDVLKREIRTLDG